MNAGVPGEGNDEGRRGHVAQVKNLRQLAVDSNYSFGDVIIRFDGIILISNF